ncbi:MAG: CU044_2847 family protein [Actinomadura sp.]
MIEVVPAAGSESTSRLEDMGGRALDAFDRARDAVVAIAASTAEAIDRLHERAVRPEQVEVEFGLKFSAQGGVVVAGVSGESTLVVKVTYQGSPSEPQ